VPARSAGQDAAEIERNRNWDPNSACRAQPGAGGQFPAAPPCPGVPDAARPAIAHRRCLARRRRRGQRPRLARPGAAASAHRCHGARDESVAGRDHQRRHQPVHLLRPGRGLHPQRGREQQRASWRCWAWRAASPNASRPGALCTGSASGPFERREEAESAKANSAIPGVEATLVAVQR
jgi:hypothetical protein